MASRTMAEKKINLVVFIREYPVGMAGTKRIQHLLEHLVRNEINIKVLSFRSKNRQPSKSGVHNSIPYINLEPGLDLKILHLPRIILYYFEGLAAILRSRKKGCKNIIYNSGGISIENILFIAWAKILRFKLVLAIEEDYSFFKDNIKLISRFKFWTVKRLDFLNCYWASSIVVISKYLKTKYLNMGAKMVALVPITAKENFNGNKIVFNSPLQIVYAGTFADKDGVSNIIEGFHFFTEFYKNAQLVLTGTSEQQLLYKEKYKNQKNIIFRGFVEDDEYYSLLRNADALCMCREESGFANAGFPFKLGEYLATGNPVICTKVSDVETYLTDDDAYLIDSNNPRKICEALIKIVKSPEAAKQIGLNGMRKCRTFFSPDVNGKIVLDLLKTL
jgi:glycosyltransferase involved in cell wall biosynthesis